MHSLHLIPCARIRTRTRRDFVDPVFEHIHAGTSAVSANLRASRH
jgi:hypothetical protein